MTSRSEQLRRFHACEHHWKRTVGFEEKGWFCPHCESYQLDRELSEQELKARRQDLIHVGAFWVVAFFLVATTIEIIIFFAGHL